MGTQLNHIAAHMIEVVFVFRSVPMNMQDYPWYPLLTAPKQNP
jgi:hypothetical protein